MNYTEAAQKMKEGNKVKLPEWIGYWFIEANTPNQIAVMTRTGDINYTPYVDSYVNRTDWEVTDGLRDFGGALVALKAGKKVALPHWGSDVFISLSFAPIKHSSIDEEGNSKYIEMTHNYLYVTSRFGLVPWNPTQPELLAENWTLKN